MSTLLSVVLPVFNRAALLDHPLESLRAAAHAAPGLDWELIVVDDASTEDIATVTARYADLPLSLHRLSSNRGLLAARLHGLSLARGAAVFFLDADDAVDPGKFTVQLSALAGCDVVYGDTARCLLDAQGRPSGTLRRDPPSPFTRNPAEFYLQIQPAPHNPIFRRAYLQTATTSPLVPPTRAYDPIAETWFYYLLSLQPAQIAYVPGPWSIVGEPEGVRLSRHWERQAAAALQLMRAFLRHCPVTAATAEARDRVGRCAFATWRALPNGFRPADAFLAIWRQVPPGDPAALGGPGFVRASRLLGPVIAGRLCRLYQRPRYAAIRTVPAEELALLFAT